MGRKKLQIRQKYDFEQWYFDYGLSKGCDLSFFGDWQKNYVELLIDLYDFQSFDIHTFLDAGCACGLIPYGVKTIGKFHKVIGVDISQYMIEKGRKEFKMCPHELKYGSLIQLPVEDLSISFLHSSQVLEHIDEKDIPTVLNEFRRTLVPGGVLFISVAAIKPDRTYNYEEDDPTHINIKPVQWWANKFIEHGFKRNLKMGIEYIQHKASPDGVDSFYEHYKDSWTVFTLVKG